MENKPRDREVEFSYFSNVISIFTGSLATAFLSLLFSSHNVYLHTVRVRMPGLHAVKRVYSVYVDKRAAILESEKSDVVGNDSM